MGVNWNDHKSGDGIKWAEYNQTVRGYIEATKMTNLVDQNTRVAKDIPTLLIRQDTGEVVSVLCSPANLLRKVAEHEPGEGDYIIIIYTGEDAPKPGRSAMKLFDVAIKKAAKGGGSAAAALLNAPATTAVSAAALLGDD